MNPNRVRFLISAAGPGDFPPADRPDVAVAGRSNVGKSSLINTLFGRKALAKVSSTPGKTRLINFFDVDGGLYLVDLPGYGYAKRSKKERESWRRLVEAYLGSRRWLAAMLVLVDLRRGPEEEEEMLLEALSAAGVEAVVVLTKSDKLVKSKRKLQGEVMARQLGDRVSSTVLFSSKTGQGRDQLWGRLTQWAESRRA